MDDLNLLKALCETFGPSGAEDPVKDKILDELGGIAERVREDRVGNLILALPGRDRSRKIMVSAHMDEVGFMVSGIEDGYLKFQTVGGIDPRVLCGRRVRILHDGRYVEGVTGSKAVHHQTREERGTATKVRDMYIDVGQFEEGEDIPAAIGDYGTFVSEFVRFGENDRFIKAKAIDDRLGCAILIELARELSGTELPYDLYICFTRCEEIGYSGATVAAASIQPDVAVVLESTAVGDLAGTDDSARVAEAGQGGVLSLVDRSTIYDEDLIRFALQTGKEHGIPVQVKKWVSGGNDAGHIHKTGRGVRCLALSAPARYLHSPSTVICAQDYFSMRELLKHFLLEIKIPDAASGTRGNV